jgi:hypothetical protein
MSWFGHVVETVLVFTHPAGARAREMRAEHERIRYGRLGEPLATRRACGIRVT